VLNKKQACELLGISPKTLQRRMVDGTYKYTRVGKGRFGAPAFTYADLRLPEPEPTEAAPDESPAKSAGPKESVPNSGTHQSSPCPLPEPEPLPEPLQVPEGTIVNGIYMSNEEAHKQRLRDRNKRYVENQRSVDLTNIRWKLLGSGKTEAQIIAEINEKYDAKLRRMNRGIR